MATIDYKEKYMQALERARQFSEKPYLEDSAGFPELKESDDERVIEELMAMLSDSANNIEHIYYASDCKRWLAWLERQLKQKPTISNEALREGIIKFGITQYQIDNWLKKYVDVDLEFSCLSTSPNNIRSWTIQDAKDGDVLVASDGSIFLFAGMVDCACKYYVALATDDVIIFNEGLERYWETSRAVHPATKEQCDLLFSKIKEAGYEWNVDKKELKKIEQSPIDVRTTGYWHVEDVEQKPAWSEEDENHVKSILSTIEYCKAQFPNAQAVVEAYNADIEWLKSLRTQNTCKPSDLPHWKKSTLPNDNTTGFNSDYFCHKGYNINYKELFEKLPKDD